MLNLILGNKAYSSWSLRAWLAVRQSGVPAKETVIPLYEEGSPERMREYSPTGKVPCLMDDDVVIWDSLAICEYVAEVAPDAGLWPAGRQARAVARAVTAEMHSGFPLIRKHMPMNVRKSLPGKGRPDDAESRAAQEREIARADRLWEDCRTTYGQGGRFLFGQFTIADCFYAPMASRFHTYGVELGATAQEYVDTIMTMPLMKEWIADAEKEPWVLSHCEL